jgi:rpsU-divergently transcribed protein
MRQIRSLLQLKCRVTVRNGIRIPLSSLQCIQASQRSATFLPRVPHPSVLRCFSSATTTTTAAATGTIDEGVTASAAPSIRDRLLVAALEQVPFYGWTDDAIAAAAASLEPPQSLATAGLLTVGELVAKAMDYWNAALRDELQQQRRQGVVPWSDTDQIAYAFQYRLERIQDLVRSNRWHEGMAVGAQPGQVSQTKDQIAAIVEITVQQCSTTFSTAERLGLGAVYIAAELHMLSDPSEGFRDTWVFLRQLVDEWDHLRQYSSLVGLPLVSSDALWTASQVGSAVFRGIYTILSRPTVSFGSHPHDYERRA